MEIDHEELLEAGEGLSEEDRGHLEGMINASLAARVLELAYLEMQYPLAYLAYVRYCNATRA